MRTDAINWFASSELCRSLQDEGKTPLTLNKRPLLSTRRRLSSGYGVGNATDGPVVATIRKRSWCRHIYYGSRAGEYGSAGCASLDYVL